MSVSGVSELKRNIANIYQRKRTATIALCHEYAEIALKKFKEEQKNNKYWNNQTYTAANTVFSNVDVDDSEKYIGFFLAHYVEYGVYLEQANDGKHAALRPVLMSIIKQFDKDLKEIWE